MAQRAEPTVGRCIGRAKLLLSRSDGTPKISRRGVVGFKAHFDGTTPRADLGVPPIASPLRRQKRNEVAQILD
jgi:hypothetical protein